MNDEITVRRMPSANMFSVRSGDLFGDELTFDEALGCVARFIIGGTVELPFLGTQEQHDAFRKWCKGTSENVAAEAAKGA